MRNSLFHLSAVSRRWTIAFAGALVATLAVGLLGGAPAASSAELAATAAPVPGETQLVSQFGSPPAAGNNSSGDSYGPASISDDGRFVVFWSKAYPRPLDTGEAQNNVWIRDTQAGTTEAITITPANRFSNGDSLKPVISGDGNHVAFVTDATDLGAGLPAGLKIVVWERATKTFRMALAIDTAVTRLDISRNGTVITFASNSQKLVPDPIPSGRDQIFSYSMTTGKTNLISRDLRTTPPSAAADGAYLPVISDDGSRIAFTSRTQLTSIPTGGVEQAYVFDSLTGSISLASVAHDGIGSANQQVLDVALSGDGNSLAYSSTATNVLDSPSPASLSQQIYLRRLGAGQSELVTTGELGSGTRYSSNTASKPSLTADGSQVAFLSSGSSLIYEPQGLDAGNAQAYIKDIPTGAVDLVSRPSKGRGVANRDVATPAVSADGRFVAFSSISYNLSPLAATYNGFRHVYVHNADPLLRVDRIGGADRYDVSAQVTAGNGTSEVERLFVTSGENFADALSAGVVSRGDPLLLTMKDKLSSAALGQIGRFRLIKEIRIIGGPASVSQAVQDELNQWCDAQPLCGGVYRTEGADRYAVSASASALFNARAQSDTVYVASGEVYADALSGSATGGSFYGGQKPSSLLLVQRDAVPQPIADELARLKPKKIVVLGGANTVSARVADELGKVAPVTRVTGADRYATSAAASASVFVNGSRTVYIASGQVFPDALSATPPAIQEAAPVLLVMKDNVPASIAAELRRLKPDHIVVLGGANTVSDGVISQLSGFLVK